MTALHGWIVLDKPLGLGSTQAVAAVKRALREGGYPKVKIGHGGTLDPLATGVLPIALGEATKLAGRMLDAIKAYDFTIRFGVETDTLDREGKVVATSDRRPSFENIEAILPAFRGEIDQVPPAYSAIKIDGDRAYDRARAGEQLKMLPRRITVHELRAFAACPERTFIPSAAIGGGEGREPNNDLTPGRQGAKEEVTLSALVSKGTYIRSLARDVARALGTVGHVTILRRTASGPFGLDRAISLDILFEKAKARALEDVTLPLRTALDDIPALALSPEQAGALRMGRVLTGIAAPDGPHFAMLEQVPVALVDVHQGTVKVMRGFNL